MDEETPVIIETMGDCRRIVINRPRKANSIDREALDTLAAILEDTATQHDIRVLEITGSGERIFCAGADLSEAGNETGSSAMAKAYDARWDRVTAMIAKLPCLTVANINGACIGGGMSIALACDMRIVAPHASFAYPAARHGFMPSPDDVARLVDLVGRPLAKSIIVIGQRITAEQAVRIGLAGYRYDSSGEAIGAILDSLRAGKLVSAVAIKRLIDGTLIEDTALIETCYRAVYDGDVNSLGRLLTP